MSWLPALLRLRLPRWPTLWLPLFLLWPLILLVFVVLAVALSVLEARAGKRRTSVFESVVSLWQLLCALRGTRVDVEAAGTHVLVAID